MKSLQQPAPGARARRVVGGDGAGLRLPRARPAEPERPDASSCAGLAAPGRPRPIVVIGAGAIVRTAHLPAYAPSRPPGRRLRTTSIRRRRARPRRAVPARDGLRHARRGGGEPGAVFDVAVPGDQVVGILERLPRGVGGADAEADGRRPRRGASGSSPAARERRAGRGDQLPAALQPRHAGAARSGRRRRLGDARRHRRPHRHRAAVAAVDVHERRAAGRDRPTTRSTTSTRSAGSPASRAASTARPSRTRRRRSCSDTRSTIILDYGDRLRCSLVLNHTHRAGPTLPRRRSIMVEGLDGAGPRHVGRQPRLPAGPPDTMRDRRRADVAATCRCAARGSPKRSRDRCRTCSGSSPAKTPRWSRRSTTRSRRWRVVEACYESSDARRARPIPRRGAEELERRTLRSTRISTSGATTPPSTAGSTSRWRSLRRDFLPSGSAAVDARAHGVERHASRCRRGRRRGDALAARPRRRPSVHRAASSAGSICRPTTSTRSSSASRTRERSSGMRHVVQAEPDGFLDGRRSAAASRRSSATVSSTTSSSTRGSCRRPRAFAGARSRASASCSITSASRTSAAARSTPGGADLDELAALPNVWCKLSGLVTEADWRTWTPGAAAALSRRRARGVRAGAADDSGRTGRSAPWRRPTRDVVGAGARRDRGVLRAPNRTPCSAETAREVLEPCA